MLSRIDFLIRFKVEESVAPLELALAPASSLPSASAVPMRRAHAPTDATKTNDPISQIGRPGA